MLLTFTMSTPRMTKMNFFLQCPLIRKQKSNWKKENINQGKSLDFIPNSQIKIIRNVKQTVGRIVFQILEMKKTGN